MKKIMKKALSLVLVLAMLMVPMAVGAAEPIAINPTTATQLEVGYGNVTLAAGETKTFVYYPTAPEGSYFPCDQYVAINDNSEDSQDNFNLHVMYSGWGDTAVIEAEYARAATNVPLTYMNGVVFAIENTADVERELSYYCGDVEGSSVNYAVPLEAGKTTFTSYGSTKPTVYKYEAPKDGTFKVSMLENEGWMYFVEVYSYDENDNLVCESQSDMMSCVVEDSESYEVVVEEGNIVALNMCSYDPVTMDAIYEDEVEFSISFEANEKDPYRFAGYLEEGTNEIPVDGLANVTLYSIWSDVAADYTVTAPEGTKLSVWEQGEYSFVTWSYEYTQVSNVDGNVYEFSCDANTDTIIGFELTEDVVVTVEMEESEEAPPVNPGPGTDPTPDSEPEYQMYTNKVTPEAYELVLGEDDTIVKVNVLDSEKETAVLGKDGFYHLNTENGPVLLVNIGADAPYTSIIGANAYGQNKAVLYNEDGTVKEKIDFYNAVEQYAACIDATGYYPLTEDLVYMLKTLGESKGWYDYDNDYANYIFWVEVGGDFMKAPVADEENAWLFACAYVDAPAAKVTEGKDATWTKETTADVTIRVDADFDTFAGLRIDGKDVPVDNYTVKEGSIIVTLKADYLETLAVGEHTVTVIHNNATVTNTTLTIAAAPVGTPAPAPITPGGTGDATNIALWVAILGLGVVAIAGSVVMKKREF